jgi:hypothetical protein
VYLKVERRRREGMNQWYWLHDAGVAQQNGIRTGRPSPGRAVSGEMPDLSGRQLAQRNGDAPEALDVKGRERRALGERSRCFS